MTPNERYNSRNVPHSSIFVDIFRPTDPANPNNGSTKLGTYRVENCGPKESATLTRRPDIDGGKNGWFLVAGDTEGSATIQRNVQTTPTVQTGDYFDAALRIDATGT